MQHNQLSGRLCTAVVCSLILLLAGPAVNAESFLQCLDRAEKLKQAGDDEGAIAAYLVAKGMAGQRVNDAAIGLARMYQKLARYSEAEAEYSNMISASGSLDLKVELGRMYVTEGKYKEGAMVFQDLLTKMPGNTGWLYMLGSCYEGMEDRHTAKDYYQRVMELAPDSQEAQAAEQRLAIVTQTTTAAEKQEAFPICPEFGSIGLGWWNLKKMPIHVYIDQGESTGYRSSMRTHVLKALDAWQHASGGAISFVIDPTDLQKERAFLESTKGKSAIELIEDAKSLEEDPIKTGIHVHFTDDLEGALGVSWTNVFTEHHSDKAERSHEITHGHFWLHTNRYARAARPVPGQENSANAAVFESQDRLVAGVAIHELGHCLGLTHSANVGDIMCSGGYQISVNSAEAKTLSQGDLASLRQHYDNYQGTGMPTKVSRVGKDGDITIYRDSAKTPSARVQNISPVKLSSLTSTPATASIEHSNTPSAAGVTSNGNQKFGDILFDIQSRNYQAGLQKLAPILEKEPNNAMALYLRAVSKVMLHKYDEATTDYQAVIKLTPGSELASRATDGLKKLKH